MCNGQFLPINQNQALFSLLGTTYGGNGMTTFALPDLRSRVPMHYGTGNFGGSLVLGQKGGEEFHTLTSSELPAHTHAVVASSNIPDTNTPQNNFWASNTGFAPYSGTINESMASTIVSSIGGSQAHENRSPYLVLNFCISLQGIFPSQN